MGSSSNVPTPPLIMWEQPVHEVSIEPFALGAFAVTREQWRQVSTFPKVLLTLHEVPAGDLPPDVENKLPIDIVFFEEAEEFCRRLQAYTGRSYRLPSEAEWEYACRAGTTTKYHFGDGISLQVANYNDGIVRPLALAPVGSKRAPNRFGLNDMHGNVLEWCADWVHETYDGAPLDGSKWNYGGVPSSRVGRGGMFLWNADIARSAARDHRDTCCTASGIGFRVALDVMSGLLDPRIREYGVVNAASGLRGELAPGEIITIWGNNIGPKISASAVLDEQGFIAKELSGVRVLFDGSPAPLLYVSAERVNTVVPYGVDGRPSTQIMIERQGQTSAPFSIRVEKCPPAIFTADSSGEGQGAIVNEDGSNNSPTDPAPRGSIVSIFATGEGQTNPQGADGKLAVSPLPTPVLPVQVLIGDMEAEIRYVGGAPGEVAGVLQINVRIPEAIPVGEQPVFLGIGGGAVAKAASTLSLANLVALAREHPRPRKAFSRSGRKFDSN